MCWVSISWAITVVSTRFSDFTDCSCRIASSNVSGTAWASDWGVDTGSGSKIARVDGANISVITILWSGSALSVGASSRGTCIWSNAFWSMNAASRWVEGIGGAWITIAAAWNNNFAFVGRWVTLVVCATNRLASDLVVNTSSGWITMSSGTCWSVWAGHWGSDNSEDWIARVGDTLIWWFSCNQLSGNVSEDALSGARAAAIYSADALIVTDFADVQADSTCKIASVGGASVVVITVDWSVDAVSGVSIASINCAFVGVITKNWRNNTLSGSCRARRWEAFVNSLAVDWGEDTSINCIASISGAWIVVAAENRVLDEVSGQDITSVGVAFVVLSKSLQVILCSVDASFNGVASFLGARIDIGTSHWGVDAVSIGARVNGTCIVVIAVLSIMFADSGCRIARINGACIVVITVFRISVNSVLAVTSRDGARIWRWRNNNRSVDAISGGLVTNIGGTCAVVVTDHWGVDASGGWVASIFGACISIVADVVNVSASFYCIARVISAWVAVVTADCSVFALSGSFFAGISGADIAVITVNVFSVETFVKGAEPYLAFVGACCILCNKIDWSVDASFNNIASIGGARIVVITRHCIVMDNSGYSVAVVFGASIIVINRFEGEDASIARLASINGARIAVVTSDWSGDASFYNIARVFGAFVCISARDCSVDAFSGVEVASIQSACIVVVTVDISIDAFSRALIARNGLAVSLFANNWSENTLSVGARIGGACVVVITNF